MDRLEFLKWAVMGFVSVIVVYLGVTRSLHAIQAGETNLGIMYAVAAGLVVVYLGYRLG